MKENELGPYVRWLREERNVSQTDVANNLGISKQYLNNIEHGRRLPSYQLVKLLIRELRVEDTKQVWRLFVGDVFKSLGLTSNELKKLWKKL